MPDEFVFEHRWKSNGRQQVQIVPSFRHWQKSARLHFENWLQEQHRFGDEDKVIFDVKRIEIGWLLVIYIVVIDGFDRVFVVFVIFSIVIFGGANSCGIDILDYTVECRRFRHFRCSQR